MQDRFICPDGISGRADKILSAHYPNFSRVLIQQSMEEGKITYADGSGILPKSKISPGDILLVSLHRQSTEDLKPYECELSVLYEDDHILVVDKESGMVVHPGDGTDDTTLVHALLHHCGEDLSKVGAPLRPGIVHRLDKETSGVMVVAKTELAHLSLVDQFANRKTIKLYQAIVSGKLNGMGEYCQPIGRHPTVRVKMSVSDKGKPALTRWKSLKNFGDYFTQVECEIRTGRTHQIRVHFSSSGHSLVGDKTYGYKIKRKEVVSFPRTMLHACRLGFHHPKTMDKMEFMAPLPQDFSQCLQQLDQEYL